MTSNSTPQSDPPAHAPGAPAAPERGAAHLARRTRQQPSPIQAGSVLRGRFRVGSPLATGEGWRAYAVYDRDLGERELRLVEEFGPRASGEPHLGAAELPTGAAPLIDAFSLPDRCIRIHWLPPQAQLLCGSAPWSREQRAWLMVALAELLEADVFGEWDFLQHELIIASSTDRAIHLHVVPVAAAQQGTAHREAQARKLCELLTSQLFGAGTDTPTADVLPRLPEGLADVVRPWIAQDRESSHAQAHAPIAPAALARALGVGEDHRRLPVLAAPDPVAPSGPAARYPRRKRSIRRRALIESAFVGALCAAMAVAFAPLLLAPDNEPRPSSSAEPPDVRSQQRARSGIPRPAVRARPPDVHRLPADGASLFAGVLDHGLVPIPVYPLASQEQAGTDRHVRVFPDAQGRIGRIEYFGPGSRLEKLQTWRHDHNGEAVARLTYNSYGRLVERWRIYPEAGHLQRFDGAGRRLDGPCSLAYELDEEGRFETLRCVSEDGQEKRFADGYAQKSYTYIAHGASMTRIVTYRGDDGAPAEDRTGVSSVEVTRDERGRTQNRRTLDREGSPVASAPWGTAQAHTRHLPGGSWQKILQNAEEERTSGWGGWHETQVVRGEEGAVHLIALEFDGDRRGIAGVRAPVREFSRVARGFPTVEKYFENEEVEFVDRDGVHRIERLHDDHGQILRECHFGLHDPVRSPDLSHVHCETREQDDEGRILQRRFYGVDGEPAAGAGGVHGEAYTYGDGDQIVRRAFLDESGKETTSPAGHARVIYEYDEDARLVEERFVDRWGHPATGKRGVAHVRYTRDAWDRWVRACFLDESRRPAALHDGAGRGAACIEREFDGGRVVRLRWLDEDNAPVHTDLGTPWTRAAVVELSYDRAGRPNRQTLYDTDGETQMGTRDCTGPMLCVDETGTRPWRRPEYEVPFETGLATQPVPVPGLFAQ